MVNIRLRDPHDRDVMQGRDICARIRDAADNAKAGGLWRIVSITISDHVAAKMKAYFESFAKFDGVLPERMNGIPLRYGATGGDDMTIQRERVQ